jgi:hypothetical protein
MTSVKRKKLVVSERVRISSCNCCITSVKCKKNHAPRDLLNGDFTVALNEWMIVNNELERMWKEVIMV